MASLKGRVSSVAFFSESSGDCVFNLVPEVERKSRRTGTFARVRARVANEPVVGEIIQVEGTWAVDGDTRTLVAKTVIRPTPASRESEVIFLSGFIKGLGRGKAEEILAATDGLTNLIELCTKRPEELQALLPKARVLRSRLRNADWRKSEVDVELYTALFESGRDDDGRGGVRTNQINALVRQFGSQNLTSILKTRPYDIVEVRSVGFATADRIAYHYSTKHGRRYDSLDLSRLKWGVVDVLGRERLGGHVSVPSDYLLDRCMRLLKDPTGNALPRTDAARAAVAKAIHDAQRARLVVQDFGHLYTRGLYKAENDLAFQVHKLLDSGTPPSSGEHRRVADILARAEQESGIRLNQQQADAVHMAVSQALSIITGGPGCGKTLTVSRIISVLKSLGRSFVILAPTGKAAKRASDVTGEPAQTIHRACNLDMQEDVHDKRYGRRLQRYDYLKTEYIFVDEASMVDLQIGFELFRRIRPGQTKVILIGDVDQLPPVGPGQVLKDLLEGGVVPTQILTEVYRQAGGSPIIDGAYAINRGELPTCPKDSYEVKILDPSTSTQFPHGVSEDEAGAAEAAIAENWLFYSLDRYSQDLQLDGPRDIQIYAPQNSGLLGIERLNVLLRNYFNPLPPHAASRGSIRIKGGYVVQEGDKVMQVVNSYRMRFTTDAPPSAEDGFRQGLQRRQKDLRRRKMKGRTVQTISDTERDVVPVMNGQVGFVTRCDPTAGELEVQFDDLEYPILYTSSEEWSRLAPAWAMSIHRSQGSETPYAFIVLHSSMSLLNRPLLYTAWTRAKKGVVLIGRMDTAVSRAVSSMKGVERYSNLGQRVKHFRTKGHALDAKP